MAAPPLRIINRLRDLVGLSDTQDDDPSPGVFKNLMAAENVLARLVENKVLTWSQVSIFAEDLGTAGHKRYYVRSFAAFAAGYAPRLGQDTVSIFMLELSYSPLFPVPSFHLRTRMASSATVTRFCFLGGRAGCTSTWNTTAVLIQA